MTIFAEMILTLAIPLGLDRYLPVPEDNPLTVEKVALGRQLFFDRRLSRDQSISCATCHDPTRGFADSNRLAVGISGRSGRRNVPSLINRGYGRAFFWDSRAPSLEDQVLQPIEDVNEMGLSTAEAAGRVGMNSKTIAHALSSYIRSILSGNSAFDRFVNGDRTALSAPEQAGLGIFRGKGKCISCHLGPTLTDERSHNTGVAWRDGLFADVGAGRGDFKTPTLREVARTAPYMHDGSLATLEDVVNFYDAGGRANPFLDAEIGPLRLSEVEKGQLVAFLRTLSGEVQEGMRSSR